MNQVIDNLLINKTITVIKNVNNVPMHLFRITSSEYLRLFFFKKDRDTLQKTSVFPQKRLLLSQSPIFEQRKSKIKSATKTRKVPQQYEKHLKYHRYHNLFSFHHDYNRQQWNHSKNNLKTALKLSLSRLTQCLISSLYRAFNHLKNSLIS